MPSKECDQYIPGFSPETVFAAGTQASILPRRVGGFVMETAAERVREGTVFAVGISIAKIKPIRLSAKVVEFVPAEYVLIRGRDRALATAEVWLDLTEEAEKGGTVVNYGVDIELGTFTKFAKPLVQAELDSTLPLYAAQYTANVTGLLEEQQRAPLSSAAA